MKICLNENCKKEFENKKDTAKYCSTSCRVMSHRKNKDKPKGLTEKQRLDILYNSILELVGNPKQFQQIQADLVFSGTPTKLGDTDVGIRPKIIRSFEYYQNARIECCTDEDWAELKSEILASSLSTKQKSLLTN